MNTKSLMGKKPQYKGSIISKKFREKFINKISRESGYKKRNRGKIKARSFIIGFMMMVSKRVNTYEAWASEVSLLEEKSVSRQAIENRMQPETVTMTKMILKEKLSVSLKEKKVKAYDEIIKKFKTLYIEDSTIFKLPDELSSVFPGNVSKGKKKSQAKIHALYNFTENIFPFLDLHSYTENDQSLSLNALSYVSKGDLLLRDMGFLVLNVLEQLIRMGVFFISRKSAGIKVYDINNKEEIKLTKELRKSRFFDKEVLIGRKTKIKMRLVILPLPPEQAAERRRKARRDRDRRLNHNKEYYELLGYSIFITNIPQQMCSVEEIKKMYGLRWQIEIIFKSWKSCFSLEKLIPSKCKRPERIYCMIHLWLLYILLFQVVWFNAWKHKLKGAADIKLSILKMAKFFAQHFTLILMAENENIIRRQIIVQCRYDKRKDRLNTIENYDKMAA
jgi:hypothetical protein